MPRGSNSEAEVSRVKSREMNDFSDGKKGSGAESGGRLHSGFGLGSMQSNAKKAKAPTARK